MYSGVFRHGADSKNNLIRNVPGEDRRQLAIRHGSAVNEQLSYRIYAKAGVENESELADGSGATMSHARYDDLRSVQMSTGGAPTV